MSKARIEWHRNKFAKGWNRPGSAWLSNPEAMGRKTCLHAVSRLLPLSPEYQQLVERSEYIDNDAPLWGNGNGSSKVALSEINDQLDGKRRAEDDPFPGSDGDQERDYGDTDGFSGPPTEDELRAAGIRT